MSGDSGRCHESCARPRPRVTVGFNVPDDRQLEKPFFLKKNRHGDGSWPRVGPGFKVRKFKFPASAAVTVTPGPAAPFGDAGNAWHPRRTGRAQPATPSQAEWGQARAAARPAVSPLASLAPSEVAGWARPNAALRVDVSPSQTATQWHRDYRDGTAVTRGSWLSAHS
jgi:hypothetical protein